MLMQNTGIIPMFYNTIDRKSVWSQAVAKRKYGDVLERVQRHMLLRVASAFRTASGEVLQVITGVMPIDLQIQAKNSDMKGQMEQRMTALEQ